jgi:hypothetical protein
MTQLKPAGRLPLRRKADARQRTQRAHGQERQAGETEADMVTENITFPEINCYALTDEDAAEELSEAITCKIEADLGDKDGSDPRTARIIGHLARRLAKYANATWPPTWDDV